jgi:uncharacterized membrane protein YhaH (DUF805 family)
MTMHFISVFATGYGRIARGTWLFRLAVLGIVCAAFGVLVRSFAGNNGAALFALLFLWCATAVSIQRLHDGGRSGWTLFALLLPVAGPVWVFLQLFKRGIEGRNRYGNDPAARMDYLKVDIAG